MTPIQIAPLSAADWPQAQNIFAEGIQSGVATFEQHPPSWEEWDAGHLPHSRWAARAANEITGWAALSPVSRRKAYAGVVEVSVYVAGRWRRRGVGRSLLRALIESSEAAGIWTLQGVIFAENTASIALHSACGFRVVGRRERIAQSNGIWRDTILMERRSSVVGI